MSKPSLLPALAALCLLSACAQSDLQPGHYVDLAPPYPKPSPTGAFDGSYFGEADLVRNRPGVVCPDDKLGVVEVGDKRLSFAYEPLIIFNPSVQPDGHLHDTVGPSVLDGQIRRDRLVMTVSTPDCETRYRMHFIGNHS